MATAKWMRVLDTVSMLADVGKRLRGRSHPPETALTGGAVGAGLVGQLEARLAGVVVSALKEAFDRDSARLDLERSQIEAERQRAELALRLELLRQAADREIAKLRSIGAAAIVIWVTSVLFLMRLPQLALSAKICLGFGWLVLLASIASAFAAQAAVSSAVKPVSSAGMPSWDPPAGSAAASWTLIVGLGLTALSVLLSI